MTPHGCLMKHHTRVLLNTARGVTIHSIGSPIKMGDITPLKVFVNTIVFTVYVNAYYIHVIKAKVSKRIITVPYGTSSLASFS